MKKNKGLVFLSILEKILLWSILLVLFILLIQILYLKSNSIDSTNFITDPLNKFVILRDKIAQRMISSKIKKVEFDLEMSNKLINYGKILRSKNDLSGSKKAVLRGEDYYSKLVQDYNSALLSGYAFPKNLDARIDLAARQHQKLFSDLSNSVEKKEDKEIFDAVKNFSKINYNFITSLRKNDK